MKVFGSILLALLAVSVFAQEEASNQDERKLTTFEKKPRANCRTNRLTAEGDDERRLVGGGILSGLIAGDEPDFNRYSLYEGKHHYHGKKGGSSGSSGKKGGDDDDDSGKKTSGGKKGGDDDDDSGKKG
ncbi:MAG: hypothetical protein SGARI_003568, partial [Bacillariaceae sp.]